MIHDDDVVVVVVATSIILVLYNRGQARDCAQTTHNFLVDRNNHFNHTPC